MASEASDEELAQRWYDRKSALMEATNDVYRSYELVMFSKHRRGLEPPET